MRTPAPTKQSDLFEKRAQPDAGAHRARELVASLRGGESTDVFDAFWQLDELPVDDVRDALVAWTGPLPDADRLDPATRLAHGLPMRPLRLRTLSIAKDADVLDLGPVAEEQLRIAGKSWDGVDLAPEERLDGELEGSFAGTLERRVLADADAPGDTPLFDVMLFAEDSGVAFAAGTTNMVALIAYGKVEMRDRRTRSAVEGALAAHAAVPLVEAAPPASVVAAATAPAAVTEEADEPEVAAAPAKRRAVRAKKTVAKKASAVKKAPAKKAPAKKAAKKSAGAGKRTAR